MKKNLFQALADAATEEELKNFFAKFFRLKLSTKNYIDLYTPQIIFEFKYDAPLKNVQTLAAVVAQTLYYVRRLKFGSELRTPSRNICVVSKNFAAFFPTDNFSAFIRNKTFDWDLAPSSPCKKLVAALANSEVLKSAHVFDFNDAEDENNFVELINRSLTAQLSLFAERKEINENNFYPIFQHWQKIFGAAVDNGRKASEYFITDIEDGKSQIIGRSVIFRMSSGELVEKFLDIAEYKNFWGVYEKISDPRAVIAIRQKMDRMSEISLRRFTGEFFTPLAFAQKAVDYLLRTVNFRGGDFRIWDMAAGTGNLEFALPAEILKYCYISTLLEDDADYCKKIFPAATVFQYDYLNDDVNFFGNELTLEGLGVKRKMPQKLAADLKNPDLKWIIFINPPFVTANNNQDRNLFDKMGVSMTAIRKLMLNENLGESSREIFLQFIYRINLEFVNRQAWLGIFSTPKYINSHNDQPFRDKIFPYKFERGFMLSSKNFQGCRGKFSVSFAVWDLNKKIPIEEQNISLDVFNSDVEKYAEKTFYTARNENYLNKWFKRSPAIKKFPPMSSALNVNRTNKDRRDRIAENFLASLMSKGNDISNQDGTAFLSGPYVSTCGLSITPENFEQCMIIHMVRRLPKATWLNDRDQFMQPTKKLTPDFVSDAVIWSLFAPSNQTVSLRDVEYEGKYYRMENNFFPFELEELRTWQISDAEIKMQVFMAAEDRFAARWIKNNRLSAEAAAVLSSGRELYKKFYAELATLDVARWKITDWDAGFYQVRMSLGASIDLSALSKKLLPQIYELGFLRDEVRYF